MKSARWLSIFVAAAVATLGLVYSSSAQPTVATGKIAAQNPASAIDVAPVAASQGAAVNHEAYTVSVLVPASVAAGKEGVVTVAISVKPGWKLNQEFPTKLVVTAPSGVTLKKDKLRVADATVFSEKKGSFPVVFTAASAGAKSFSAKFRFAVCTDATCDPKTEELSWAVTVN